MLSRHCCHHVTTNNVTTSASSCSPHHLPSPHPTSLQAAAAPRAAARRSVRALAVRAEISYVMVKPDGVQRGLVGDIISRFERKGFKLVGLKLYQTPKDVAEEHYKELSSKPFYGKLVEYIVSGPVVAMVSGCYIVTFVARYVVVVRYVVMKCCRNFTCAVLLVVRCLLGAGLAALLRQAGGRQASECVPWEAGWLWRGMPCQVKEVS